MAGLPRFIQVIRSMDGETTARDIADILWLSAHLKGVSPSWLSRAGAGRDDHPADGDGSAPGERGDAAADGSEAAGHRTDPGAGALHAAGGMAAEGEPGGQSFPAPTLPALPGRAEIHRALRPLKRRVDSRVRTTTDIRATADFIAETGIPCPIPRPETERWLDAALVVEDSPSMAVWRRTVRELYGVLVRSAIFRDVRLWRFARNNGQQSIRLHEGFSGPMPPGPGRHPSALSHPEGRRLILLVSDAVSRTWHEGLVYSELAGHWDRSAITALVQMMPYWLWERTGLDRAITARLAAAEPGAVNDRLRITGPRRVLRALKRDRAEADQPPPKRLRLPVVMLSPDFLGPLADSVAGRRYHHLPGVIYDGKRFPAAPPPTVKAGAGDPDPEALVRRFRSTASHPARRLAAFLAAVPLTLPIMRAVQGKMLPDSRQYHLAEVMLSGTIRRTSPREKWLPSDEIRYGFFPRVREQLLTESRRDEILDILTLVSDELSAFVNEDTGRRESFQAVLAGGARTGEGALKIQDEPFAQVAAFVLRRLGGRYARVAEELERNLKFLRTVRNSDIGGEFVDATIDQNIDETKTDEADEEGRSEGPPRPRYSLRKEPLTDWVEELRKVFRLNENGRPLDYVQNDYQDNGDGTVTDRATGLIWQQSGSKKSLKYENAKKYVEGLNRDRFAGYTDWRLPTVDELASLLEPEKKGRLYIDPIFDDDQFWCWTADQRAPGGAWGVYFSSGFVGALDLDFDFFVRAVRP